MDKDHKNFMDDLIRKSGAGLETPRDFIHDGKQIVVEELYYRVWDWVNRYLVEHGNGPIVPPEFVVSDKLNEVESDDIDGNRVVLWTNATNRTNWSFWWKKSNGEKIYNMAILSRATIMVYPKAVMKSFKNYWRGHIPYVSFVVYVSHILMHEAMHFVKSIEDWKRYLNRHNTELEVPVHELILDFQKWLSTAGTYDDEIANEKLAMSMSHRYFKDSYFKGGLVPLAGGAYDLQRREKDPLWALVYSTLELSRIDDYIEFKDEEFLPDSVDSNPRALKKRAKEIVRSQMKWDKEHNAPLDYEVVWSLS